MLIPSSDSDPLEGKKLKTFKKLLKSRFLDYLYMTKTEFCDQKTCRISDKFDLEARIIWKWMHPFYLKQQLKLL